MKNCKFLSLCGYIVTPFYDKTNKNFFSTVVQFSINIAFSSSPYLTLASFKHTDSVKNNYIISWLSFKSIKIRYKLFENYFENAVKLSMVYNIV